MSDDPGHALTYDGEACCTAGCPGDPNYGAPGRMHLPGCIYPRNLLVAGPAREGVDFPILPPVDLPENAAYLKDEWTQVVRGMRDDQE